MAYVRCPACSYGMPDTAFLRSSVATCPTCHKDVRATLLPALYKSPLSRPPSLPEDPPAPGETVCFYNPNRRATKGCDHCGVFISDAWAAQWGSQTVCLKCLEELRTRNSDVRFESKRTLWDNVALLFALGPWVLAGLFIATIILYGFAFFCILLTAITAPAAVFVALRYWNAPRSLVPRGRGRLVTALLLALMQIAIWVVGGTALVTELVKVSANVKAQQAP